MHSHLSRRARIWGVLAVLVVIAGAGFGVVRWHAAKERADRAASIRSFGVGACVEYPINSFIDVSAPELKDARSVPCSHPHVFQILALGNLQTALDACDGKYRMTTANRYVNILVTGTVDITGDLSICEGSNAFTGPGKRVIGSFVDGTEAPWGSDPTSIGSGSITR